VGEFTKWELDWKKAFLNPTKSVYIKEKAVYLIDNSDANPEPYQDIEINWKVFNWPFYIYDDYYIKWEWTYGLDEILPDEIETYLDYEVKVKIYRYDDFVEMYEEYYWDY
jgi:hypothetical protein